MTPEALENTALIDDHRTAPNEPGAPVSVSVLAELAAALR
jgi:hypothetical protein